MKLFRIALFALLVAAVSFPQLAQAGQRTGAFSLSPMIGYHFFEGDQNTEDDFFGSFSVGYNITQRWAAEFDVQLTKTETDLLMGTNEDMDVWSFGVNALYHFNPDGSFVPYLTAGLGGMTFQLDNFEDDSDYKMNWGVGAKFFLSKDLALRMEARHIIDLHSDRSWDRDGSKSDNTDHNVMAMAGLYWQFGGVADLPPAPLDSDGDGIPDVRDKCPDTPLGVLVDAVGCPPSTKPAPLPPPPPAPVVVKPAPAPAPVTKEIITFNLLFGFDKHNITDEMIPVLEQAKGILNEDPSTTFMVLGHSCSIGPEDYNQKLSERRANSVKNWLVSNGISAHRLESTGYGETQPKYDNNTRDGRKLNRRVELMTH